MYAIRSITGGYICRGEGGKGYSKCDKLEDAATWDSQMKAKNVLKSSIPKCERDDYEVYNIGIAGRDSIKVDSWVNDQLSELSSSLIRICDESKCQKKVLYNALSQVDKELCDIIHYIENNDLNARDGYKAFDMVRIKRRERRKIKNTIREMDIAISATSSFHAKIVGCIDELKKMYGGEKYHPRAYPELFVKDDREIIYNRIKEESHEIQKKEA